MEVAAAVLGVAGVVGTAVYAAILNVPGPGDVARPHWLGLWLAMFTVVYGAQIVWQRRVLGGHAAHRRKSARLSFVYYTALDLAAAALLLGALIALRLDGILWGVAVLAALGPNTLVARRNARNASSSGTDATPDNIGGGGDAAAAETPLLLGDRTEAADDTTTLTTTTGRPPSAGLRCAIVLNAVVLGAAGLALCLCTAGTWVQALGYRRYPPAGALYPVAYNGGTAQVMAFCTGPPANASVPTFLFDIGGGGHSSSDLYGLQFALNDAGRRVCTYDYPGCGASSYAIGVDQPSILAQVTAALGEPGPFILVGTMDGAAERIYAHALAHPDDVAALIPISYGGVGEFPGRQAAYNLTDAEARDYARTTLAGRRAFGNVILALGVQWGLMGIFAGPSGTFVPPEREAEKLFLNLFNDKQWTIQVNILSRQVADPDLVFVPSIWATNRTLAPSIPVIDFFNRPNMTAQCLAYGYALGSADCDALVAQDAAALAFNEAMVAMTAGSELIPCDDCERDGAYLSGNGNIDWLVANILRTVGNITIDRDAERRSATGAAPAAPAARAQTVLV